MRHFFVLFKHEFRMQFPRKRSDRIDIMGNALSWMITLLILGVFVYLLSTIVDNYITIKPVSYTHLTLPTMAVV